MSVVAGTVSRFSIDFYTRTHRDCKKQLRMQGEGTTYQNEPWSTSPPTLQTVVALRRKTFFTLFCYNNLKKVCAMEKLRMEVFNIRYIK
jgi:hypothetical protein